VGESGCGKSTLGRSVLHLDPPTGGQVLYRGTDVSNYSKSQMRQMRQKMQIIMQDPYASLNPRMTVYDAISASLKNFHMYSDQEQQEKVLEIMEKTGLSRQSMYKYPHEFSGGQRQRIVIARALVLRPEFVVCDEPVSALDVSVRSQVINMMCDLQKEMNLTYLFISHDLSVVKYISTRIAVMYLGRIVELAETEELFANPLHPYTQALMSAVLVPGETGNQHVVLTGDVPSPRNPPSGCRFHTRCHKACKECSIQDPHLREVCPGHFVACSCI
jgi:peptide/nickel transport system ATP-binding protein/oligopeptide transport system ATP-binding protein